jgi:hypothetical protein
MFSLSQKTAWHRHLSLFSEYGNGSFAERRRVFFSAPNTPPRLGTREPEVLSREFLERYKSTPLYREGDPRLQINPREGVKDDPVLQAIIRAYNERKKAGARDNSGTRKPGSLIQRTMQTGPDHPGTIDDTYILEAYKQIIEAEAIASGTPPFSEQIRRMREQRITTTQTVHKTERLRKKTSVEAIWT